MAAEDDSKKIPNLNDAQIHQFSKGWSVDLDNHAENPKGYADAWNGRLYSEDGTLAFVSVNGSKMVYNNDQILKYNGYYAFQDELIVFGKSTFPIEVGETEEQTVIQVVVDNFNIVSNVNTVTGIPFSTHFVESETTITVPVEPIDEDDFSQNMTEDDGPTVIDVTYGGLFKTLTYMPSNPIVCEIEGITPPINNQDDVTDFIMSFKYNSSGILLGRKLWVGYLNIPMDAVICTEGVDENASYKRVYFTDYYNYSRVVNVKDPKLSTRKANDFNISPTGTLLNPRVKSVQENGSLKAMTVFYVMRLITENGQITDFSALSRGLKITEGSGNELKGGDISESTNKSVIIECYIPDYKNFKEVQLVAIEYEAKDVPSAIRVIGKKKIDAIVSFEHVGSEPEFKENVTLADIYANSITWKYNSDFTTKNNKLIASSLRNDPSFINSKNVALDFALAGFSHLGETHDCLLNPDPVKYNLINNNFTQSFFYVQRRLYRKIEVFGNFSMKLFNSLTSESYELSISDISYKYVNRIEEIAAFLLVCQEDVDFNTKFPNLKIRLSSSKILFEPIDELVITDFYNYILTFSTNQVIIDLENDTEKRSFPWPTTDAAKNASLVYGGVSNGWYNGNGVKVTMHSVKENVLSKNTDWMVSGSKPLQIKEPSLRKCVMKGEIYRLGIQCYKNGNRLFTIILGDLKIPDIGQVKRELDETGNIILNSDIYKNWSVVGNEMYAEKIELQFDVRINCEFSKEIDSYQIVYVERNENNRTILAQGISGPLERIVNFGNLGGPDENLGFEPEMVDKWALPSNGGPVYDHRGILNFDTDPNMNNASNNSGLVITNRKSFYFDSPDFVHNKISSKLASSCQLEYIESISTDHDRYNILGGYNEATCGYDRDNPGCMAYYSDGGSNFNGPVPFGGPKFSQKIPSNLLAGDSKTRPFYVNVSVFSNLLRRRSYTSFQNTPSSGNVYEIDKASEIGEGQILSGYKFNDTFDYANHAFTLGCPGWFYCGSARSGNNREQTIFRVNNIAGGRKSVFIKTKFNFFNETNISQRQYLIKSRVNFGDWGYRNEDSLYGRDSYIVSNLKRNIQDSIYGGRTEFAYASNEYIPLSDVIPVTKELVVSQIFYVEGDSYCSLYLRNKSSYRGSQTPVSIGMHWDNFPGHGGNEDERRYQYNKYNAWCYSVVLESTIEPRLANSEEFYLFSSSIDFKYEELYNSGYLQENDLRKSIPVPYDFKDEPILNNVIAVSNTKLNGDSIDAWSKFSTNEFYELDKNKGSVLNIIKYKDEIYAVQGLQTSKILIDERSFITPDKGGSAIQIAQGDGKSISGHEVLSDYGTSFRRAIIESPFGFVFYDDLKKEIVKIVKPLLVDNFLALEILRMFKDNDVVSAEGYYDDEFKETNIRFRTKNDINFVVSYNELLEVFNGKIEYNNDLYFMFQNKVIAPYESSQKLGELNSGNELELFESQKNLKLKVISAPDFFETKINKGLGVILSTNYPLLKTTFITSLGQTRVVPGTHHWYKIREGLHTFPAKNPDDYDDLRGEWCSFELEINSVSNTKIKLFSIINYFRQSYK